MNEQYKTSHQVSHLTRTILCAWLLSIVAFPRVTYGQATSPTETLPSQLTPTLDSARPALTFVSTSDSLTIISSAEEARWSVGRDQISVSHQRLQLGSILYATDSTLELNGTEQSRVIFRFKDLSSVAMKRLGKSVEVSCFAKPSDNPATRLRRGNLTSGYSDLVVDSGRFVRGSVVSLGGSIVVDGEVDKSVFTLIGDIRLSRTALVRGNIVSLFGRVEVDRDARYYGDAIGVANGRRKLRVFTSSQFALDPVLSYDRVDGLTFGLQASYPNDRKQRMKLTSQLAYSAASDRLRGNVGISYALLPTKDLQLAVSGYRQLTHDDDRLTTRLENTLLALTFKEDLWEWYEASGAAAQLTWTPDSRWRFGFGYRNEMIEWLPAHVNLWALSGGSGGSHLFRENFSTIPSGYDSLTTSEFSLLAPNERISELFARIDFPSTPLMKNYSESGFAGSLWGDIGGLGTHSSTAYARVGLSLIRSQKLMRHVSGLVGFDGALGGTDLPVYRVFSIGGFGTVSGYRLRQFVTTSYYRFETELRIALKSKVAALGLLSNYAVVDQPLANRSQSTLSDVGLRLYLSTFVHLTASAPTGAKNDQTIKFWLSFRHPF